MATHSKRHHLSDSIEAEAMKIARGTQRPGQTKEQTKLIAQGIKKGIELYKKQQSAKARALDKKLKRADQQPDSTKEHDAGIKEMIVYKQRWLPWLLLILSWVVIASCLLFR